MEDNDILPGGSIPTNEELIESVVKNCRITSEKESTGESNVENPVLSSNAEELEENDDHGNSKENKDDDFIDEDLLKENEKSYSEEEKLRLKSEAMDLKKVGNEQFKKSEFREALLTYTLALRTCPYSCNKERSVLYANRGAAKLSINLNETAIDDCTKAIELDPTYVKALLRRAQLYEKADKLDESLEDYKKILELDSSHKEAILANMRLPPLINERNEKLKTEMLGKLKDLGNMVLKPFGLSTNNFQMIPNETGGYSVNFKQ